VSLVPSALSRKQYREALDVSSPASHSTLFVCCVYFIDTYLVIDYYLLLLVLLFFSLSRSALVAQVQAIDSTTIEEMNEKSLARFYLFSQSAIKCRFDAAPLERLSSCTRANRLAFDPRKH
jgi:hypothetical protein